MGFDHQQLMMSFKLGFVFAFIYKNFEFDGRSTGVMKKLNTGVEMKNVMKWILVQMKHSRKFQSLIWNVRYRLSRSIRTPSYFEIHLLFKRLRDISLVSEINSNLGTTNHTWLSMQRSQNELKNKYWQIELNKNKKY